MRIAGIDEIRSGKTTDIYFIRARAVLDALGVRRRVTAAVTASALPNGCGWAVLAGTHDSLALFEGLPVGVDAMPEGTVFHAEEPVMQITGDYLDFAVLETALLGYLCQQSGVATKSARCRKAAGDRSLISFGARRMHPALAPVIDRNAYIGGCDAVSVVLSAELLGMEPVGTMPHSLIIMLGDVAEAVRRFDDIVDKSVPRVALVDTFCDEKTESLAAAEAIGDRLSAVRLDTPGSRRGDMLKILREVRWELDIRGFGDVKIIVSGGIDEEQILRLNPVADGYGVGTAISNARTIDFALDIVEIEGVPVTKRGKTSGRKQVLRCDACFESIIVPWTRAEAERACPCGGTRSPLLSPVLQNGRRLFEGQSPDQIRAYVAEQLARVGL